MGRPARTTVTWREVRPKLQTGDLVFLHSHAKTNRRVELLSLGLESHVGMVVREDVAPGSQPALWHSAPKKWKCGAHEDEHIGAQLNDLTERLTEWAKSDKVKGISIRRLQPPLKAKQLDGLRIAFLDLDGKPFPRNRKILAKVLKAKLNVTRRATDSVFCSELVAATYLHMGLLTKERQPAAYYPKHFAAPTMKLSDGWSLGPLQRIELNSILSS